MKFPMLQTTNKSRNVQMNFGGLNYKEYCGEGEFSSQTGISADEYPLLVGDNSFYARLKDVPRADGAVVVANDLIELGWRLTSSGVKPYLLVNGAKSVRVTGYIEYISDNTYGQYMWEVQRVVVGKKLIVRGTDHINGGYIWVYIDLNLDGDSCNSEPFHELVMCEQYFDHSAIEPCAPNGASINAWPESYYKDRAPNDGDYKVADGGGLYQWNSSYSTWIAVNTTKVRIITQGAINKGTLKAGDGVRITLNTTFGRDWPEGETVFPNVTAGGRYVDTVIDAIDEDSVTFTGLFTSRYTFPIGSSMWIERRVPDMEFVTENNNRLWGCSADGHEIYCSKLGDVTNWYVYEGISTDSWAATVGTEGKFTGATSFNNNVYFFKQDTILKVLPSSSGAHVVIETKGRGAINNKTIQIVNNVMYYLASDCVCGFEGSVPFSISDKIGDIYNFLDPLVKGKSTMDLQTIRSELFTACAVKDKYYLVAYSAVYAYDTKKGIWTLEKSLMFQDFPSLQDKLTDLPGARFLYFYAGATSANCLSDKLILSGDVFPVYWVNDQYYIRSHTAVDVAAEPDTYDPDAYGPSPYKWDSIKETWQAVTGNIGYQTPDHKYVSKINIYCKPIDETAQVTISVIYENSGQKVVAGTIRPSKYGNRGFNFTLVPKRCDHFQIMIEGRGRVVIYSITKTIEEGSDVT